MLTIVASQGDRSGLLLEAFLPAALLTGSSVSPSVCPPRHKQESIPSGYGGGSLLDLPQALKAKRNLLEHELRAPEVRPTASPHPAVRTHRAD